jgi:hypothetical protein
VHVAKRLRLEKRRSACFTRLSQAFVGPGEPGAGEEDGIPRIIENQIIIRGAPVIARSLTRVGTAAMAAGIAIRSRPVIKKQFSIVPKKQWKERQRLVRGTRYESHYSRAIEKRTVWYRTDTSRYGQVDMQERRVRRSNQRRQARRGVVLRGAGSLAMAGGQLVPYLAYGYVASRYLTYETGMSVIPTRVDTVALAEDAAYLHGQIYSDVMQGIATARAVYHIGKTALKVVTPD